MDVFEELAIFLQYLVISSYIVGGTSAFFSKCSGNQTQL